MRIIADAFRPSSSLRRFAGALLGGAAALALTGPVSAMSLREAVAVAIESNPTIGQAIQNREATEFELRQARGLYLPRLDLEASIGGRRYDSPSQRFQNISNRTLKPTEGEVVLTQRLFDGFGREAEVERQASRVDGASFRVLERAEYIALSIAREYTEVLLQQRIVGISSENLAFHRRTLSDIDAGVRSGTLTDADRFQAQERLTAALARVKQAEEDLANARIRFYTYVGLQIGTPSPLPALRLPSSLTDAIGKARVQNPQVAMASADIDAAEAQVKAARSKYYPEVLLEGRARAGNDIDAATGHTSDVLGRAVVRWNLFDGGIKNANEQEQIRRASEQRLRLHEVHRQVEELVRTSWERKQRQSELAGILGRQLGEAGKVVGAYQDQFKVGRRSLLDVLDAQNTRFNAAVLTETARYAALFAEYRISAATGTLVASLGLKPPAESDAYARAAATVPPTPDAETYPRYSPTR
jgi:outer membrane protein, adhesin transport system